LNQEKKIAYVAVTFHEVGEKQFVAHKGKKNRSILKSILLNFLNHFLQKKYISCIDSLDIGESRLKEETLLIWN
jgi:hypothetical protein